MQLISCFFRSHEHHKNDMTVVNSKATKFLSKFRHKTLHVRSPKTRPNHSLIQRSSWTLNNNSVSIRKYCTGTYQCKPIFSALWHVFMRLKHSWKNCACHFLCVGRIQRITLLCQTPKISQVYQLTEHYDATSSTNWYEEGMFTNGIMFVFMSSPCWFHSTATACARASLGNLTTLPWGVLNFLWSRFISNPSAMQMWARNLYQCNIIEKN